jgi:hypothetical protein
MDLATDPKEWAAQVFGGCELGNLSRTNRLIKYAAAQAAKPTNSTGSLFKGEHAGMIGAYRFLSNDHVEPSEIGAGVYKHTAGQCKKVVEKGGEVVVVEDSSTVGFSHDVAEELGDIGGAEGTKKRGFIVHTALAFDAKTGDILGLVDQQRWVRPDKRPSRNERKQRPYEEKEQVKWQRTSEHVRELLGPQMSHVIHTCDREADIFEYLQNKIDHGERFVVRAAYNRRIQGPSAEIKNHLREELKKASVLGERTATIQQRGRVRGPKVKPARKEEKVPVSVRSATVTLLVTQKSKFPNRVPTTVNAVWVREEEESARARSSEPLDWLLLTSESVDSFTAASRVIELYEGRWRIEEHFKILKSGCGLKDRRLQSAGGLERLLVILSAIATRIQQLGVWANADPKGSCEKVLSREYWTVLFLMIAKDKSLPKRPPTLRWAMESIAKLGGWTDSKRNGRMGWISLWRGWLDLEAHVEGAIIGARFAEFLKSV